MTKRHKTPTLAQLRKLAKRKGQMLEWWGWENWKVCDDYGLCWLSVCGGKPVGRAAVFAALSSLPDKPKGAKR